MISKNKFLYFIINCIGIFLHIRYEINSSLIIFIFFSITFNLYVFLTLHHKNSYFHLFFSIFLWLGFYFKFLCVEIFLNGVYPEIRDFDGLSLEEKNYALLCSALFCWSLILSFFINNQIFNYNVNTYIPSKKFRFYLDRYYIHIIFVVLFSVILMTVLNYIFQFHQKGIILNNPKILYIAPLFKSLLIIGFSSLICLIIFLYNHSSKKIFFLYLFILENFFSSISSLSRGMIFNSSSLLLTFYYSSKKKLGLKVKFVSIAILFFFTLFSFIFSILIVDKLRTQKGFYLNEILDHQIKEVNGKPEIAVKPISFINDKLNIIRNLIIRRFVGIDSMMNLAANKNLLSFEYFYNSFNIKYDYKIGFDYKALDSIQINDFTILSSNKDYVVIGVKTPGIFAFLFYSGSIFFVFFSLFVISSFFYHFEKILLKLNFNNIYFCSLISQVIAYRLSHLGLNPISSLKFFIPIIIIIIMFHIFLKKTNKTQK